MVVGKGWPWSIDILYISCVLITLKNIFNRNFKLLKKKNKQIMKVTIQFVLIIQVLSSINYYVDTYAKL